MVLAFCRRGLVIPICLYLLVGRYMKERNSGLSNESSKTKRTGLFQRITAAFLLPLIIIYKKVSSTFLLNLSLFWHINEGIEEIMADYVHQEMTRNWVFVYLRLFLLIVIKDVFLSLVFFLNKSKNLMDRTHPWLLRNISALRCGRNVLFCFELEARALSSIKVWNPRFAVSFTAPLASPT
ncbi:succinate dehydrogenase subunit 4 (mitochondrion) [Cannabis sativa]|nr:succinate dehydrogenase subunit 4 [Cannabis sativa]ALF04074.1 succinate dehydrogenase subunit 4 [Cannabis sativa]AMR97560.1 succinate dehydrogenase subunit 4 [Cannabis sativa]ANC49142.1 succinate dehydrogenase subunit 4 [Cannabis sativa]